MPKKIILKKKADYCLVQHIAITLGTFYLHFSAIEYSYGDTLSDELTLGQYATVRQHLRGILSVFLGNSFTPVTIV